MLFVCAAAIQIHVDGQGAIASTSQACPDLTGTYEALRPKWLDQFHLYVTGTMRPTTQPRQFATFQPRNGGYTIMWHMPRQDVLAAARKIADRDPYKYASWLDMALGEPQRMSPSGSTEQSWTNQMAHFGPVFRVDATLPAAQCDAGWFLVGTHSRTGPPDVDGGMDGDRDAQLWLRRDKDGSLALRWRERRKVVVIREGRYTQEYAIRLWSSDHIDHWPAMPTPDLSPLLEDELPPRIRPKTQLLKCQLDPGLEREFIARLKAILPARGVHENGPTGFYKGRVHADDTCEPMPSYVTISTRNADAAQLAQIETFLKTDPFFERLVTLESEMLTDGRLMQRFKMTVLPR